jgi:hypothetical protein
MRQRERLIARITQMRRAAAPSTPPPRDPPHADRTDAAALAALAARVASLEEMVEGLQDSVHRESTRQSRRIADLEARIEPSVLAVELSRDARKRGL